MIDNFLPTEIKNSKKNQNFSFR